MIIDTVYHPKLIPHILPHHYDFKNVPVKGPHTFKLVAESSKYVQDNKVLLYIIGLDSTLLDDNLSNILPKEYLLSIQNRELLLAIDLTIEAKYIDIDRIYQHLIIEQSIPESQILLIGATLNFKDYIIKTSQRLGKNPIKYEYYGHWARVQKITFSDSLHNLGYKDLNDFQSGLYSSHKKKFVFLNNNWKEHRIALLCLLNKEGILPDCYISFSDKPVREGLYERLIRTRQFIPQWLQEEQNNSIDKNWQNWVDITCNKFNSLTDSILSGKRVTLPYVLDTATFDIHIPFYNQHKLSMVYKNSFVSIVTETEYSSNNPVFLTEKIFKPISFKHPFIICGQPYSLKHLQLLGYKTFDGIINENYDNEVDDTTRMIKLLDEIKRINHFSPEEIELFKNACKPVVEYNFNKFMSDHFVRDIL